MASAICREPVFGKQLNHCLNYAIVSLVGHRLLLVMNLVVHKRKSKLGPPKQEPLVLLWPSAPARYARLRYGPQQNIPELLRSQITETMLHELGNENYIHLHQTFDGQSFWLDQQHYQDLQHDQLSIVSRVQQCAISCVYNRIKPTGCHWWYHWSVPN